MSAAAAKPTVFDIFDCQVAGIDNPTDGDILCGKDKTYNLHPGNLQFRQLIEQHGPHYAVADTKQNKMAITKCIVDTIQQKGARFLEKVDGATHWTELANAKARDKTSHALRFFCKNHVVKHIRQVSNEDVAATPMAVKSSGAGDTMNSTDTMMRDFAKLYTSPVAAGESQQQPSLLQMEVDTSIPMDTVRSTDLSMKTATDTWRSLQDLNLDTLRSQDLRDIMECVPAALREGDADIMALAS